MKKGYIKVSGILIKESWKELYIFFKDFRPTFIEHRYYDQGDWVFWGESDLFDEVKEGEEIPQYDVVFTQRNDGSFTYEFIRVKK